MPLIPKGPKPPALPTAEWFYDKLNLELYVWLTFPEPMNTGVTAVASDFRAADSRYIYADMLDATWIAENKLRLNTVNDWEVTEPLRLEYLAMSNCLKTATGYEYPAFEVTAVELPSMP